MQNQRQAPLNQRQPHKPQERPRRPRKPDEKNQANRKKVYQQRQQQPINVGALRQDPEHEQPPVQGNIPNLLQDKPIEEKKERDKQLDLKLAEIVPPAHMKPTYLKDTQVRSMTKLHYYGQQKHQFLRVRPFGRFQENEEFYYEFFVIGGMQGLEGYEKDEEKEIAVAIRVDKNNRVYRTIWQQTGYTPPKSEVGYGMFSKVIPLYQVSGIQHFRMTDLQSAEFLFKHHPQFFKYEFAALDKPIITRQARDLGIPLDSLTVKDIPRNHCTLRCSTDMAATRLCEKCMEQITLDRPNFLLIAPKTRELAYFLHKFQVRVAKLQQEHGDMETVFNFFVTRTQSNRETQKLDSSNYECIEEQVKRFVDGSLVVPNINVHFSTQAFHCAKEGAVFITEKLYEERLDKYVMASIDVAYYIFQSSQFFAARGGVCLHLCQSIDVGLFEQCAISYREEATGGMVLEVKDHDQIVRRVDKSAYKTGQFYEFRTKGQEVDYTHRNVISPHVGTLQLNGAILNRLYAEQISALTSVVIFSMSKCMEVDRQFNPERNNHTSRVQVIGRVAVPIERAELAILCAFIIAAFIYFFGPLYTRYYKNKSYDDGKYDKDQDYEDIVRSVFSFLFLIWGVLMKIYRNEKYLNVYIPTTLAHKFNRIEGRTKERLQWTIDAITSLNGEQSHCDRQHMDTAIWRDMLYNHSQDIVYALTLARDRHGISSQHSPVLYGFSIIIWLDLKQLALLIPVVVSTFTVIYCLQTHDIKHKAPHFKVGFAAWLCWSYLRNEEFYDDDFYWIIAMFITTMSFVYYIVVIVMVKEEKAPNQTLSSVAYHKDGDDQFNDDFKKVTKDQAYASTDKKMNSYEAFTDMINYNLGRNHTSEYYYYLRWIPLTARPVADAETSEIWRLIKTTQTSADRGVVCSAKGA